MNRPHHILYLTMLLMLSLASVFLLPSEALSRLTGEADLSYADYESRAANQSYSGSSFAHRYSVLYDASGTLVGGRLGKYDVSVGYEWLAYDTTENNSDSGKTKSHEKRAHINYGGDVVLNPKELPVHLHLYSQDPNRSTFKGAELSASQLSTGGYTPVQSNLITGIDNGIHVINGATLVMGVKNGMTNGYNEVLRHFPMLMLDYRDQIDKDLKRAYPVDSRLSRLAFVSLNKKDNWFHYRYVTFDDKIDSSNNYTESQFQLGTVDHRLERRWIDFSNWLRVSADGQFTRHMNAAKQENYEEISINMFGTARRQSWELRTFNNFTRYNELNIGKITYMTTLPVYASGIISPTAVWNGYAKYDNSHTATGDSFTTANGAYSIDAFRKSPFTLAQGLGVEQVTVSSGNDALILTGNVGTSSTALFANNVTLKARYDIRNYRIDSVDGATNNFIDQEIKTSARYAPTNQLFIMAQQDLRFTSGTPQTLGSSVHGAEINSPLYQAPDAAGNTPSGSSYQSTTGLRIDWMPAPHLRVALAGSETLYVPEFGERDQISRYSAQLDYKNNYVMISSAAVYASGGTTSNDSTVSGSNSYSARTFSSTNSASVIFNRSLDAKFGLTYVKSFGTNSPKAALSAEQSLNYRYRSNSGYMRNLFEINESFTSLEEVPNGAKYTRRKNTAMLGAKYFPIRQLMIAGGAKYYFENNDVNGGVNYYGSISMGYRLLTASIDYSYGKNRADGRVEKRLSANLKKKF